jgi:WD40 repeat protein/tRNA A-37 threonylcarbamoyl transferase component Bud32
MTSTGDCLDEESALAFIEGKTPSARRSAIEQHLDGCDACRRLLGAAALLQSAEKPAQAGRTPKLPVAGERYTLLGEHARGGQARVMLAFDENVGRTVALKELLPKALGNAMDPASWRDATERFLREAELTGQLAHPGVVPVFEIGCRPDGAFFYTMQWVRGRTLSEVLTERRDLPGRLALLNHFLSVCQVVAYAHSRGILHRDIKPQNIMVGDFGETVLLDWGLAKQKGTSDAAPLLLTPEEAQPPETATRQGTVVGTPGYMSPEQARGDLAEIDERSDIYGLGAVLFEILTERLPPAPGRGGAARVRELCPQAPPELAMIAEKALALEKRDRYPQAAELAQDITAFMTGGRVAAYAYTPRDLVRRFAARHRWILAGMAIAAAAVLVALGLTSVAWRSELASRRAATASERAATARGHESLREGASLALLQGDAFQARAKLREALELGDSLLARTLWRKLRIRPEHFVARFSSHVDEFAFSPLGRELAVGLGSGSVQLIDVVTRARRSLRGSDGQVFALAYSPDGSRLAASTLSSTITIWELKDGRLVSLRGANAIVSRLAFSPDGVRLAAGDFSGAIAVWDVSSGRLLTNLKTKTEKIWSVAFSPDGRHLAASGDQSGLVVWDLEAQAPVWAWPGSLSKIAFSPDGAWIAGAGYDGNVYLSRAQDGQLFRTLQGHGARVRDVAISPGGRLLASASADGTVRVWGLPEGELLHVLGSGKAVVSSAAFSADGALLAAATEREAWVWDLRELRAPENESRPPAFACDASFSPDGRRVASADLDGVVRLWDAASGALVASWPGHPSRVMGVCFSPSGELLASVGLEGALIVRDAETGAVRHRSSYGDRAWAIACAPDNRRFASGGYDGSVRVWDARSGRLEQVFESQNRADPTRALRYSVDGRRLLAGRDSGRIEVWDTRSGRVQRVLSGHTDGVFGLAFEPHGNGLVSGSADRTVRLWSLGNGAGRILGELPGRVLGLAWDPRGGRLAIPLSTGDLHVWSQSGAELRSFPAHRSEANRVEFSPDGETAVSAGDDGTLRLWETANWRPKWLTRAVVHHPAPQILTQAGWQTALPSGRLTPIAPDGSAWRRAVESSREAIGAPGGPICVSTDTGLEIWDLESDSRVLSMRLAPPFDIAAIPGGCSVIKDGQATLHRAGHPPLELAGNISIQGAGEVLALVGSEASLFDGQGRALGSFGSGAGVTAVAPFDQQVVVGYRDGGVELRGPGGQPPIALEDTPGSAVMRLSAGPSGTLVAGFADGTFGVWSAKSGVRLEQGSVHGAVRHLVMYDQVLVVASEVGSTVSVDLSVLTVDYCDLLREIWARVPILWRNQGGVEQPPDTAHPCRSGAPR